MGLRWLVTGGCGFIGTALIRQLIADGEIDIRIVDDLSVGSRYDLTGAAGSFTERTAVDVDSGPSGVELVVIDIKDREAMLFAGRGIDVMVHLAANTGVGPSVENPVMDCETNVLGTLACLESARANGVQRFVFASSGAPIGEVEPPIHEELAPHPVSPYGASKLAGEGYCSAYARCYGVSTVALRFGNVYGPGSVRKQSVVAKFIGLAMAGETLEVYGDGGQTRDFIYIGDLLQAVRLAGTVEGVGGEVFQVATSRETSVGEMVEALAKAFDEAGVTMPEVIHSDPRQGDVRRNFSDTSKAERMLGWQARTNLADGLRRTVEYFRHDPGAGLAMIGTIPANQLTRRSE